MNLKLLKKAMLVCLGILFLGAGTIYAQSTVTGVVTSAVNGTHLIGAQVLVRGTMVGTVTDAEGRYSINAGSNDVLVVSYLGYEQQEVPVGNRTTINIALEVDEHRMDEVIVLGYSSARKAELTSSVVTLTGSALTDVASSDVGNLLQGKVAGVMISNASGQPGTAADIRVRGVGSFTAGTAPLFVVDGIPGGSYNPNDIETLTVLKDVGATAIYGSAGANGVIVITTKQAVKGQATKVDFKARYGLKQALTGRFSPMDSEELYYMQKQAYSPALFSSLRPKWLLDEDFDWMNAAFGLGSVQDYYAAASGSTERMRYILSVNHYKEKGTLINTNFGNTSARINLTSQLAKNLEMTFRATYDESNDSGGSSFHTIEGAYRALPWDNPYDDEGNLVFINSGTRPDRPASTTALPTNNNTWFGHDELNFLHDEEYNYTKSNSRNIVADLLLNWDINDWLSASTTNRFSRSSWMWTEFLDPRTKTGAAAGGALNISQGIGQGFGTTNMLKAAQTFGTHSLTGLLGWEWGTSEYATYGVDATGMPEGMDVLNSATPLRVTGVRDPGRSWSAFAQAQYSYMSRYFLTGIIRADASSNFAPKKRIGYFPSISGAWIISNEKFLESNHAITFLKLRASYGSVGNNRIPSFRYLDSFEFSSQYQNIIGAIPMRTGNDYLQWETATTAGIGIDINLYTWLEVNLDYYDRINSNLLLETPVSPSTGFFSNMMNTGRMRNNGLELQLNSTNMRTPEFIWTTSFNIAYNKNRITSLPPTEENPDGRFARSASGVSQMVQNGMDIFSWYLPEWYGVDPDNGDPLWVDSDGNPTNNYNDAPHKIMGTALPVLYGGLSNSLSFRGFTLDFNITYNYGNKIFNFARISMDGDGAYVRYNQLSLDNGLGWSRWEKKGDEATHPKPIALTGNKNSNAVSSRFLEDGSFIRLRNVTLSYDLPRSLISKINMSSARVYVAADNLFTLTKFSGMDPEVRIEATDWELVGMYSMNYPVGRLFSLGVELSF